METDYSNIMFAEFEKLPEKKDVTKWFGTYKGIKFEINNFQLKTDSHYINKDNWTHYVWLNIDDQFAPEFANKLWLAPRYTNYGGGTEHVVYDYYESVIGSIEFHGGCTWYSKESSVDDKKRVVKVGCDYQHLWDQNQSYNIDYVFGEVKKSIDSVLELSGPVKIRSWGDGKYRYLEEFTK